jgi:hypothetical protein
MDVLPSADEMNLIVYLIDIQWVIWEEAMAYACFSRGGNYTTCQFNHDDLYTWS